MIDSRDRVSIPTGNLTTHWRLIERERGTDTTRRGTGTGTGIETGSERGTGKEIGKEKERERDRDWERDRERDRERERRNRELDRIDRELRERKIMSMTTIVEEIVFTPLIDVTSIDMSPVGQTLGLKTTIAVGGATGSTPVDLFLGARSLRQGIESLFHRSGGSRFFHHPHHHPHHPSLCERPLPGPSPAHALDHLLATFYQSALLAGHLVVLDLTRAQDPPRALGRQPSYTIIITLLLGPAHQSVKSLMQSRMIRSRQPRLG
ncbi:hypothetical protein BY996DRAFT_2409513 [Phakopsora pachyrhizi]|nr:hypothetical protein BY996DRAFT_2409513 [Phakopsora pachyrhizi]